MSQESHANYDEIDRLLEQKEEELRELGAMRVRALEKTFTISSLWTILYYSAIVH